MKPKLPAMQTQVQTATTHHNTLTHVNLSDTPSKTKAIYGQQGATGAAVKGRYLGMVILRNFSLDVSFLKRLLSRLAVLGLEQVSNVVPHVVCQHGRMSWLRTL